MEIVALNHRTFLGAIEQSVFGGFGHMVPADNAFTANRTNMTRRILYVTINLSIRYSSESLLLWLLFLLDHWTLSRKRPVFVHEDLLLALFF